jgi:hypothetical protein
MPFVTLQHRGHPSDDIPGDRAFMAYTHMMALWKANPRWTTVDEIAATIWPDKWRRAAILSFLVFFAKVAMPYEDKKEIENGKIE